MELKSKDTVIDKKFPSKSFILVFLFIESRNFPGGYAIVVNKQLHILAISLCNIFFVLAALSLIGMMNYLLPLEFHVE